MLSFVTQNIEFILAIIGLAIAVIAVFFSNKQKAVGCVIGLLIMVCLILIVQYVRTWDYKEVPNVTQMPYKEARLILHSRGFIERPLMDNNSILIFDDNAIVKRQVPDAGSQYKENELVELFFQRKMPQERRKS